MWYKLARTILLKIALTAICHKLTISRVYVANRFLTRPPECRACVGKCFEEISLCEVGVWFSCLGKNIFSVTLFL